MTKHVSLEGVLLICALLCVASLGIVNAIYAIRSPSNFLRSKWTFRRGFGPETHEGEVRKFGIVTIIGFGYGFVIGCKLLIQVVRGA